jgi:alanine racemase
MEKYTTSKILVNSDNLNHNIESFRRLTNAKVEIGAVLKSNAYGHNLSLILQAINKNISLAFIYDLSELRAARSVFSKEIMLLGPIAPQDLPEICTLEPIVNLSRPTQISYFEEICRTLGRKLRVHIAIDTGFNREGILIEELNTVAEKLKSCRYLSIEGIYSHFSSADEDPDLSITRKQLAQLERAIHILNERGFKDLKKHIAATSGALRLKEELKDHFCIRLGLGLYGLWPNKELAELFPIDFLKPALSLVSHVAEIKSIKANQCIGYNQTFKTSYPSRIALIPIGYGFGISRMLSNCGEVIIAGNKFPIRGRVSMNSIVVDITGFNKISEGEEAVLIGQYGKLEITAQRHAELSQTSVYEVVTRLSHDLPRELNRS